MIMFDFSYYRPESVEEAVNIFQLLKEEKKAPVYYAGGTELICQAGADQVAFGSVVDLKDIPDCNVLKIENGQLVIGAAVTLSRIAESGLFPLLGEVCRGVADHTSREKITIGGNICGKVPYREAVLPFLVSDSEVVIAGPGGLRKEPINQVFKEKLQLSEEEFLVQLLTNQYYTTLPYKSSKRTKYGKSPGYPLAVMATITEDRRMRAAFSGICAYPFRSMLVEEVLGDQNRYFEKRIEDAISHLPGAFLSDILGSAEYREFVLRNMLADALGWNNAGSR